MKRGEYYEYAYELYYSGKISEQVLDAIIMNIDEFIYEYNNSTEG